MSKNRGSPRGQISTLVIPLIDSRDFPKRVSSITHFCQSKGQNDPSMDVF